MASQTHRRRHILWSCVSQNGRFDRQPTHFYIVMAKTRVAPIKRQTIPRLELCGALVVAQILFQCKKVLDIPMDKTFAWTSCLYYCTQLVTKESTQCLLATEWHKSWRWRHVVSPADCASRGLYPAEMLTHTL